MSSAIIRNTKPAFANDGNNIFEIEEFVITENEGYKSQSKRFFYADINRIFTPNTIIIGHHSKSLIGKEVRVVIKSIDELSMGEKEMMQAKVTLEILED